MTLEKKFLGILLCIIVINGQIRGGGFVSDTCCQHNKIVVSGDGVSSGQPNIAKISVRFQVKAQTSEAAVNQLSKKVGQIIFTILEFGLPRGSFETQSLNVNPEYNYDSGKAIIVGYIAGQSLTVTVKPIDATGSRVAQLIDLLAKINGIEISNIDFDIEDKTSLQTSARAKAYADAKKKAEDYAEFAGLRVGRVLTIDDFIRVQAPPQEFKTLAFRSADSAPTNLIIGKQDVNYRLTVTFQASL